jgi:hypothetical protein
MIESDAVFPDFLEFCSKCLSVRDRVFGLAWETMRFDDFVDPSLREMCQDRFPSCKLVE